MKAWKEFHITLFLVALISGMAADGPQAHGNELNPDFWWDYGETDKKHATFAPKTRHLCPGHGKGDQPENQGPGCCSGRTADIRRRRTSPGALSPPCSF
jgi:hypothetical protein